MSRKARRHGGGGRTGQHHTKTPRLRSYTQSPAGPVTIMRADGTTEIQAPDKAVRDVPKPHKRAAPEKQSLRTPTMKEMLTVDCRFVRCASRGAVHAPAGSPWACRDLPGRQWPKCSSG